MEVNTIETDSQTYLKIGLTSTQKVLGYQYEIMRQQSLDRFYYLTRVYQGTFHKTGPDDVFPILCFPYSSKYRYLVKMTVDYSFPTLSKHYVEMITPASESIDPIINESSMTTSASKSINTSQFLEILKKHQITRVQQVSRLTDLLFELNGQTIDEVCYQVDLNLRSIFEYCFDPEHTEPTEADFRHWTRQELIQAFE